MNILLHPHFHKLNPLRNRCNICQQNTIFLCDETSDRYIRRCVRCRSTPKYRAIVHALQEATGKSYLELLAGGERIYEMSTTSPLFRLSHGRENYVAGGYFPDKPFGVEVKRGVWNQDCQALSFAPNSFSLVVSSETMEHVRKPWQGFREIRRVLKPGGLHVFTIPYYPAELTKARIDTSGDTDVDLLPRHYHRDPYCKEGALVYTDFGYDLVERLEACGFHTNESMILNELADVQDDLRPVRVFVSTAV